MTNNALDRRGGSESYLETVAAEFRGLGHDVTFFSATCGAVAGTLRERGFEVYDDPAAIPGVPDVIHGQHTQAVAAVRERFPRVPLVFATHSWFIGIEDPVPPLGAAAFVCFNDLTHRRLMVNTATAGRPVHRLTQPVGVSIADGHRSTIRGTPTRAVAVSRGLRRLAPMLEEACAARGIAFTWVGRPGADSPDPRAEMQAADIVFAIGRTALEGMAAARAVAVLDESNYGGWVSAESYPELEASGFISRAIGSAKPPLDQLLERYSADLGSAARVLVAAHHTAPRHAVRLLEIYSAVAETPHSASGDMAAFARLAAERHHLEGRAVRAEWQLAELRRENLELRADRQRHIARIGELRRKVKRLRARLRQARVMQP